MAHDIEIYELGDIAAILGIEKSRVKSWTIGRPFSVRPSLRVSPGKGSSHLFSRNDLYCFALVARLNEIGAPVAAVQTVLEKLSSSLSQDAFWTGQKWLGVGCRGRDSSFEVSFNAEYSAELTLQPEDEIGYFYAVYLKSITDTVAKRIDLWLQEAENRAGELARATGLPRAGSPPLTTSATAAANVQPSKAKRPKSKVRVKKKRL